MVSRAQIEKEVKGVISAVTRIPEDRLRPSDRLREDYGLSNAQVGFLAVPFTRISEAHGGKSVSQVEVRKQRTLGDCIDLVHAKANSGSSGARRKSG